MKYSTDLLTDMLNKVGERELISSAEVNDMLLDLWNALESDQKDETGDLVASGERNA